MLICKCVIFRFVLGFPVLIFLAEHPELLSTALEAQRTVSINACISAMGFFCDEQIE